MILQGISEYLGKNLVVFEFGMGILYLSNSDFLQSICNLI